MGHRTLPISPAVRTQLPAIPSLCQEHSSSSCRPKRAVQYTNNIQYPTGRGRNRPSAQGTERGVTSLPPKRQEPTSLASGKNITKYQSPQVILSSVYPCPHKPIFLITHRPRGRHTHLLQKCTSNQQPNTPQTVILTTLLPPPLSRISGAWIHGTPEAENDMRQTDRQTFTLSETAWRRLQCEERSVWPRRSDLGMKIGGHQRDFLNCLFSTNDCLAQYFTFFI